jgi:hypothetical protein
MKTPVRVIATTALVSAAAVASFAALSPASGLDRHTSPVVFVCDNGVAMSVWSALTFGRASDSDRHRVTARHV